MRKDKKEIVEMRRSGSSYNEISQKMQIPKSTLSEWFSNAEWSKALTNTHRTAANIVSTQRIIELNRVRGVHLERIYEEARVEAREELKALRHNPLFIAGLMLYWGEGEKLGRARVKLTNTDSEMIRLYIRFLTHICRIPVSKIRGQLLLYPDLNNEECLVYWTQSSGLSHENFTKLL